MTRTADTRTDEPDDITDDHGLAGLAVVYTDLDGAEHEATILGTKDVAGVADDQRYDQTRVVLDVDGIDQPVETSREHVEVA